MAETSKMVNFKATIMDWRMLQLLQKDVASNATVADALREAIHNECKRRGLKYVPSELRGASAGSIFAPLFTQPAELPAAPAELPAEVKPELPPPCTKCGGVVLKGTASPEGECFHCVADGQLERSRQKNAKLAAAGEVKAKATPKKKPVTRPAAPGVNGKTKKAPGEKAAKPGKTGKAAVKKGKVKA